MLIIKSTVLLGAIMALGFLSACNGSGGGDGGVGKANIAATSSYSKGALSFDYPKSWKLDEDFAMERYQMAMFDAPEDNVCIVQLQGFESDESLLDIAQEFAKEAKVESPGLKFSHSEFGDPYEHEGFERIDEGFGVKLVGIETAMVRSYRSKVIDGQRLILIFQYDDEAPEEIVEGFETVRKSIKVTDNKKPAQE